MTGTTKVMLVDDHAVVRMGFRLLLDGSPDIRVVAEAESGEDAVRRYTEVKPDVVVLDLSMPGRSGIELIRQVKAERSDLRVLVLSMHDEQQYAVRAIRAGASGYLTKDTVAKQLVAAIEKIASGGMFITPAVAEALAIGLQTPTEELPHKRLTDREYEILLLLASGESVNGIGKRLHLSAKTVSTHKTHILEKMNARSLVELVRYAITHDLLESPDAPK